jgi:ABC-type methionine transport system ATPase subunit
VKKVTANKLAHSQNDAKGTIQSNMAKVQLTLIGNGDVAQRPWISDLAKQFTIDINIVRASVDSAYGIVELELNGPVEEIQRATAWLMTSGLHVEAKERAVGA